jgi:predicted flap endonuclease-1-like 5' DNA nuclease
MESSQFIANLGWLLAGLALGWAGNWLFDRLYRRDGPSAGQLTSLHLAGINGEIDRLKGQLGERSSEIERLRSELDGVRAELTVREQSTADQVAAARAAAEAADHELAAARVMLGARFRAAAPEPAAAPAPAPAASVDGGVELSRAQQEIEDLRRKLHSAEADAEAGAHGFVPRRGGQDDLTILEGVGPKIAALLRSAGLDSFGKLADAPQQRLVQLLEAAGPRFKLANPGTWPQQARLAHEARWEALRALQNQLSAGVAEAADRARA